MCGTHAKLNKLLRTQNLSVAVTNVYVPYFSNITEFDIEVHADKTVYDVHVPAARCETAHVFVQYLQHKLEHFATLTINNGGFYHEVLKDGCSEIVYPEKINRILGDDGQHPVDPMMFCKHIVIACPLVEFSFVHTMTIPLLYVGPATNNVKCPKYHRVIFDHVTCITLEFYDMLLHRLEIGSNLPVSVELQFKAP